MPNIKINVFFLLVFLVRVVHGFADCDYQDTSVMKFFSDFFAELVNDGKIMLAYALRTKYIQKSQFSVFVPFV